MQTTYISLGCDCSIAYQLSKLNLRTEAYPLDWCSSPHLETIIQLFKTNFEGFDKFDNYTIKKQSIQNFNTSLETSLFLDSTIKSYNKLLHKQYKIVLPHEYEGNEIDIEKFETKYFRRIKRLLTLLHSSNNDVIFIRLGNTKEKQKIIELENILQARCKCKFKLLFINYDDYKTSDYNWYRGYIPWKTILTITA